MLSADDPSYIQLIALPKHATFRLDVFAGCPLLFRVNGMNTNWIQSRFDDLPLHQLCYNINYATTDTLASIQTNDQALTVEDAMGMIPLHILCYNPSATPNMIKQLVLKNHNAAQVTNIIGMTPLHMYLISRCILSLFDLQRASMNNFDNVSPAAIALLKQDGDECDIHEMVGMGLEFEVMDVVLSLNGKFIGAELGKKNEETGLHPFMSGAISRQCRLAEVYMMTLTNSNILL